ncbi:MAG: YraN family protein [Treponema sp.]|nr:YraN family protein [Treponema sp.]
MNRAPDKASKGRKGEDQAAAYLERQGMGIIARNVRSPSGELDLVGLEGETIVFVEVKTWSAYGWENLQYGITMKKRRRIIETAKHFLAAHREYSGMAVRFDVVFISPASIRHLTAAFEEED